MTENEMMNGWTFEETIKTAENLMEEENNVFKWDVLRHLRDFAEHYKEQLEQYRAIGLTPELIEAMQGQNIALINDLGEYQQIGTIEEFKALKEKNVTIANGKWIDTQPEYSNGYYKNVHVCSNCFDYYTTEYDEMKFCPKCGAKMTED